MGRLSEDMTNLRDEIDALRNGRVEFIAGLKHGMSELKSDVAGMQQGFRKDHSRMAGNMKDNLKAFTAETKAYVSNLKNDVTDMQDHFRSDHADMARKLKDDLNGFASGITSSVTDLMDLFRSNHADMAGNMKDYLKAFMAETEAYVSNLKNDVTDMQDHFRSDHADMARKLKDDLQMFVSGIKSTVADLKRQFCNEHIEMTGKADAERKMFFSNVKQALADLKLQTANFLRDISDDLAGAHRAWSGATPTPAGKRATGKLRRKTKVREEPEMTAFPDEIHAKPDKVALPVKDQELQESTEEAPLKVRRKTKVREEPDDLTQLHGIGPTISNRLNAAGIFTFAKLASSSIDQLRKALGESAKFANLEMWIKQAGELSS
jgi:predicted flap endonuclease-1-like 5' DNA nuclease/gas vesicle protein